MTINGKILLYVFIGTMSMSHAQNFYKKASDYGLDQSVGKIIEVTYQFNFGSRKCEEIKKTTLEFNNEGRLLSKKIQMKRQPSEITHYSYDERGRLKTIISNDRTEYSYQQKGDTLKVKEVSGKEIKSYHYIYKANRIDELNMFYNDTLFCKEDFIYSNNEMKGKTVQFYNEFGEEVVYEEHKYRNGKTVFFRKRNSINDDKTCYFYFNSTDNSLDFEETVKPGREAVISKDCNYQLSDGYWVSKSEELFSVPVNPAKLSAKQKHLFYFRKIFLKDGTKIGSIRIQKDFVDQYIE